MRSPQIVGAAITSSPTKVNVAGVALKMNVVPVSLVANRRAPIRTGEALKVPPSRPRQPSMPEAHFL